MKGALLVILTLFLSINVSEQISFYTAQQCAFGSYPPSDRGNIPTYVVNLDSAPKDRWTNLVQNKKNEIIQLIDNLKNISEAFFHGKLIHLIDTYFPYIARTLPAPFYEEIKGISDATGIPIGEITLYNIFYEIFSVCTSIVAQDKNGEIYHGRNFDFGLLLGWDIKNKTWTSTEILRRMVVTVDYQKNGKTIYKSMQLAGYVGVFTGMKPNLFSLSVDERFKLKGGYIGLLEWILGYRKGHWMGFLARQVLEDANSFNEAKKMLTNTHLLSPVYFILGGNKTGEGTVITRDFTSADVWDIGTGNSTWFLIETNYDHWNSPPFFDDRRTPTIQCLNKLTQEKLSIGSLFDVLTSKPALNKLTVYTSLMHVSAGKWESYLQECKEPCMPW